MESAIPSKWQQQMMLQGFEVVDKTIQEFIEFCERLEFSKQVYDSAHTGQKANVKSDKTKSGSKASAGSTRNKRKTDFYCLYHSNNTSHNTDDCKVLKAQAENIAAVHSHVGAGKYKNKRNNDSAKKLESFKTEIVRSVVDSLSKMRPSRSSSESNPTRSKRRKVTELDNFNLDLLNNLDISDSKDNKSVQSVKSDASDQHSLSS